MCDDPKVIASNVDLKVSSGDPDYKDMSREKARADFLRRISEYEAVYETITEPKLSYVRIYNVGKEATLSRMNGYLSSRIAFYLMNLHVKPRNIFMSRVCALGVFILCKLTRVSAWRESVQCRGEDWRRRASVGARHEIRAGLARVGER